LGIIFSLLIKNKGSKYIKTLILKKKNGNKEEFGKKDTSVKSSDKFSVDNSQDREKNGKGTMTKSTKMNNNEEAGQDQKNPERKIEIGDDPNETERKIPRMR